MSSVRRPCLLPLVPFYRAGLGLKNRFVERNTFRVEHLARPVISIGSLSAGGAGKTPVVIALAHLLQQNGVAVDVLSRGYGRRSAVGADQVAEVNPQGSAAAFGDEPLEMARAGLSVYVGADRFRAGLLAEHTGDRAGHLLDDGFQHRRLARDLEIVLLTAQELTDTLLPAGNLREPLSSLGRANIVILREEEVEALTSIVDAFSVATIWIIRRTLRIESAPLARPFAFCGIARPEGFVRMLAAAGQAPAHTLLFGDHHAYTPSDIERILAEARGVQADGFYTTAKDLVKFSDHWLTLLETIGPVHAPALEVKLDSPDFALSRMLGVLRGE